MEVTESRNQGLSYFFNKIIPYTVSYTSIPLMYISKTHEGKYGPRREQVYPWGRPMHSWKNSKGLSQENAQETDMPLERQTCPERRSLSLRMNR